MEKVALNVPGMYGDHHVLAVRDLLGKLPGVENIYATSAFKQVVVTFDPAKAKSADFEKVLKAEGYMESEPWPAITDAVKGQRHGGSQFVVASGIAETVRFAAPPEPPISCWSTVPSPGTVRAAALVARGDSGVVD